MTVSEMIKHLGELQVAGHGDKVLGATHGASGSTDPVSFPFLHTACELDAEILGIPVGTDYVDIYIGN